MAEIIGTTGDDNIVGTTGDDIIYGDPAGNGENCETGDGWHESNDRDISNIVLYMYDPETGAIIKVKLDSFDDQGEDADDLPINQWLADNYPDLELVAATVKAGNNFSGWGPGEGTMWLIDEDFTEQDLLDYLDANNDGLFGAHVAGENVYDASVLLDYEGGGDDCEEDGFGDDTIDGGRGSDIIYGNGGNDTLIGDSLYDFEPMPHAISNVVLYLRDAEGGITKVKIDDFDSGADVFDANNLDLYGFVDANYSGSELVATTIKAGNNKSGMGPGEGELFILGDVELSDLEAAGGRRGQADETYDYVTELEPLGAPNEDDTLVGGTGNDFLTGGVGDDTFVFSDGDGQDVVTDFTVGEDLIDFTGDSITSMAELLDASSQDGDNTVIDTGDGDSVTLIGVNVDELTAGDFLFA